jgi:hypothetical protein
MNTPAPLTVHFVAGTRVLREARAVSTLSIVQNGPPGTFVVFADGSRVPLPTDQIVHFDDDDGAAHVAFGGMSFIGVEQGELVFHRVRDLAPEAELSPERGRRMTLAPTMVRAIDVEGARVWPH